jgi:predicted membrane channel-forming protein YqfA (hemolysin III family)
MEAATLFFSILGTLSIIISVFMGFAVLFNVRQFRTKYPLWASFAMAIAIMWLISGLRMYFS